MACANRFRIHHRRPVFGAVSYLWGHLLLAVALLLLSACADDPPDPEAEIRQLLAEGEQAVEARSLSQVEPLLAASYQDSRGNRQKEILRLLTGYFLSHQRIHLLVQLDSIILQDAQRAQVALYVATAGQPIAERAQLLSLRADLVRLELDLVRTDDQWQVVAAQWRRANAQDFLN